MIKTRRLRRTSKISEARGKSNQKITAPAHPRKLTLDTLASEMKSLRERLQDLEDLRDLEDAIKRNAGKPLISWAKAKVDLEIE